MELKWIQDYHKCNPEISVCELYGKLRSAKGDSRHAGSLYHILGHADAETTMDIYADATMELQKAELIDFEEYFKKQKLAQSGVI